MYRVLSLSTLLLATACLPVGKDYQEPSTAEILQESYKFHSEEGVKEAEPVADWWTKFEDKSLTKLVEDALKHNRDIEIARANLQAARLFVDESNLGYFPTVTSSSNFTDQMFSQEGAAFNPPSRRNKSYQAGFDAIWELDLFGQVSSQIEKAEAEADSYKAQLDGAYVTIAAEVARSYAQLRGAQNRLDIARLNEKNQKKTYELTQMLLDAGKGSELDIERARANLQNTRSTIPTLEAAVNANLNRLAVLTGKAPKTVNKSLYKSQPLPSIPPTVSIGKPTELLKRRPDIRQAESELQTAVAQYNINVANLYPEVSFRGALGFMASTFSALGTAGTSTIMLAPTINWSAFNLRRVDKQIDRSDALAKARLANFEKTVLEALEEVDTALVNFNREEERRANLLKAAEASAKAEELAQQRYEAGLDSYLEKLDSERSLLQAQDNLAQSETAVALNLIAVYKALGGGWQIVEDKEPEKIEAK